MLTDGDRCLAEFAAGRDGVFTRGDALEAGLSEHQVQERVERDWVVCHAGVFRIAGSPESWFGRLRAAAVASAPHGAISHRSAAALYGLPGGRTDVIELTCPHWLRSRHASLVVHESRRLDPGDIDAIEGIAVTRPERVVLDLAYIWPSTNFLEAVIQSARRKRLITYDSMEAMFQRHAPRATRVAGSPSVATCARAVESGESSDRK